LWEDSEFKDFVKFFNLTLDLKKVIEIESKGLVGLNVVDVFGRNPRVACADVHNGFVNDIFEAMEAKQNIEYIKWMNEDEFLVCPASDEAVHRLFAIDTSKNFFQYKMTFISPYIAALMDRCVYSVKKSIMLDQYRLAHNSGNPDLISIQYEVMFHTTFQNVGNGIILPEVFSYRNNNRPEEWHWKVEICDRRDRFAIEEGVRNVYFRPTVFDFPTFDSAFVGDV
jgi:hypothetical protein